MSEERILKEAAIAAHAVRYKVWAATVTSVASVFGIPLLPIVIPFSHWYWTRYYRHLRVVLTTRELKVHRGILVREEKSIPLEKITDLAVFDGPIMRRMKLKGIRVETAGQSSAGGALVSVVGLEDTVGFRDRVLAQRDRITDREEGPAALPSEVPARQPSDEALLRAVTEIRDTLRRIEGSIGQP